MEWLKIVYKLQSISQICSVITTKVMISYIDDSSIIDVWFKDCKIIDIKDDFVSLEDGCS